MHIFSKEYDVKTMKHCQGYFPLEVWWNIREFIVNQFFINSVNFGGFSTPMNLHLLKNWENLYSFYTKKKLYSFYTKFIIQSCNYFIQKCNLNPWCDIPMHEPLKIWQLRKLFLTILNDFSTLLLLAFLNNVHCIS